jgi:hypothetical protein
MLEATGAWLSSLDAALSPRKPGLTPGRPAALGRSAQGDLLAPHQGVILTATTLW